jgi:hypothetical protein
MVRAWASWDRDLRFTRVAEIAKASFSIELLDIAHRWCFTCSIVTVAARRERFPFSESVVAGHFPAAKHAMFAGVTVLLT